MVLALGKYNSSLKYKILCPKNLYNKVKMYDTLEVVKYGSLISI